MKNIFIDSDIFVRELRYFHDKENPINSEFIETMRRENTGVTSIFNVLETCGVLSYNVSTEKLIDLFEDFSIHFSVEVLFPTNQLQETLYEPLRIFDQIKIKQSLGDAQVAYAIRHFANRLSCFVTWNSKDFDGKIPVPVFTPSEFLKKRGKRF